LLPAQTGELPACLRTGQRHQCMLDTSYLIEYELRP